LNKNILVFPCGSEIGLEINNALKFAKGIKLVGGSSVSDHGKYVYKHYVEGIPNIDGPDFIEAINKVIADEEIDYIFPAHDSVVLKLSQHQEELNAEVLTSESYTCEVSRSKKHTYEVFDGESFNPQMYSHLDEVESYPVFLKPNVGQGSKGVALARTREEAEYHLEKNEDLLILEYLPGKEYTIDCFTDRHGELRFTGMRERKRIKSGISVNSHTLELDESVKEIAEKINQTLKFRGMWFFQVKEDQNGKFKLLEIAPRIAGTMNLFRNKGVNFPLLTVFDRLGYDVDIIENDYAIEVDRAFTNRFKVDFDYERVYIDFDDTVTYGEKVNPYVMMFIYQCLSKDIELILITKHIHDIRETLSKLKIDANIFKEIIHITREDLKHSHFKHDKKSIFIDDSYNERKQIHKEFGLPVFDLDAVESLIDWRH
jgi:ATP-grasp in the biosynthetic pathway with Ter operon